MAGVPLEYSKKSWAGQQLRRDLLSVEGIELPDDMGEVGQVPADDILDAAACAWTAFRHSRGSAGTVPSDPDAEEPVIWY